MWEAPLLVLDGPDPAQPRSKAFLVADLVQEISYLEIEDACHQVRSVCCTLVWQQLAFNLLPLGVSGEGYDERRLANAAHNHNAVLVQLLHKPISSHITGR